MSLSRPMLPLASATPCQEPPLSPAASDFLDVIGRDGRLRWANGAQASVLGLAEDALGKLPIEAIYAPESVAWIRGQLARPPQAGPAPATELTLLARDGREVRVLATALPRRSDTDDLTLSKRSLGDLATRLERLESENRLLRRIADAGKEAHWCIEFGMPIDLALPVDEIVFRVFSYPSYWRLCNQAMSRLYGLPHHLDFCQQSVRTHWPRSPENEAFVRQIIQAGYAIDGALSVDTRHDGSLIRVENDVRADLEDGHLVRLWGSCRLLGDMAGEPS